MSKLLHQKKPVSLINLESTINEREIKWFKSYDSITVNRNKPLRYGDSEALFGSYPTSSFPDVGVFWFRDGLIDCSNGWITNSNHNLLLEATWYVENGEDLLDKKLSYSKLPFRIKGKVLSLLSDFAINN